MIIIFMIPHRKVKRYLTQARENNQDCFFYFLYTFLSFFPLKKNYLPNTTAAFHTLQCKLSLFSLVLYHPFLIILLLQLIFNILKSMCFVGAFVSFCSNVHHFFCFCAFHIELYKYNANLQLL